jgi:hypothetical protein
LRNNVQYVQLLCAGILLKIADAIHASSPREVIIKFIITNFDDVSKLENFQSLSKNLIIEILTCR